MFLRLFFMVTLIWVLLVTAPAHADNLALGEKVFQTHCEGCHLNGGNIIRRGKNLKSAALKRNGLDSVAAVEEIVIQGKNNMSSFRDRLNLQEISAVSAYVLARAEENWKS